MVVGFFLEGNNDEVSHNSGLVSFKWKSVQSANVLSQVWFTRDIGNPVFTVVQWSQG